MKNITEHSGFLRRRITSSAIIVLILLCTFQTIKADDGYRLWLRYDQIKNEQLLQNYKNQLSSIRFDGSSPTLDAAKYELSMGLSGLLGMEIPDVEMIEDDKTILVGTPASSKAIASLKLSKKLEQLGDEGFLIERVKIGQNKCIVITANTDIGVLYGVFRFLKVLQTNQPIKELSISDTPKMKVRLLNHWDNLDRTVERGYAGFSLWDWQKLPDYSDPRYVDYARANASIGINGTVLTNVNANAWVLTDGFLDRVAALADAFRPYGLKVYLTARFSAPVEIGGLETADPLDENVKNWWNEKAKIIYAKIPDFGGFLVKANSEGQPGPQNYGRSHADGANMLADAVKPFGGIVMWRAFVYSNEEPVDRAKQAYNEFKPLDGKFRDNVLIQVKNGPIDFQPREPFHPMFGGMQNTSMMMEFQITKEYLGFSTHLVYLSTLYKECLDSDTYAKGEGSYVSKTIDGSLFGQKYSGMAGVSNIGTDRDWCGSSFEQANWYAFGRLAWDYDLSSETIADEWIRMTFSNDDAFIKPVKQMMLASREITVNYMTPLGLHHQMGWDHHYGPGPWINIGRADWTSIYYNKADSIGIGFDRSSTGSNATEQYFPEVAKVFDNIGTCPEEYLLWFHHVSWDHKMQSGRTLWDELCYKYNSGVDSVRWMQKTWDALEGTIDADRYQKTRAYLNIQEKEAIWWKDACLLYFQTFSKKPFPKDIEQPKGTLEEFMKVNKRYVPGI